MCDRVVLTRPEKAVRETFSVHRYHQEKLCITADRNYSDRVSNV